MPYIMCSPSTYSHLLNQKNAVYEHGALQALQHLPDMPGNCLHIRRPNDIVHGAGCVRGQSCSRTEPACVVGMGGGARVVDAEAAILVLDWSIGWCNQSDGMLVQVGSESNRENARKIHACTYRSQGNPPLQRRCVWWG